MKTIDNQSVDYPFTVRNLKRAADKNRDVLETIKQESDGLTLKEAFTSEEVRDFVPQIFNDEIIAVNLRENQIRGLVPTTGQSSQDDFKQRYAVKSDNGVQILPQLTEAATSKFGYFQARYGFNKLLSANLFSYERLMDSPLQDAITEATFTASQFARTENMLAWDNITTTTSGQFASVFDNYISMDDITEDPYVNNETGALVIMDALKRAFLSMTNRLTDRQNLKSLVWLWGTQVEATLWEWNTYQKYMLKGAMPSTLSGAIENPFSIPRIVIEPGYFAKGTTQSEWTPCPSDIYLVNPLGLGIRERVGMRIENFTRELIQASGTITWERLGMWTRYPRLICRISPNETYSDQNTQPVWSGLNVTVNNEDIMVKVGPDEE